MSDEARLNDPLETQGPVLNDEFDPLAVAKSKSKRVKSIEAQMQELERSHAAVKAKEALEKRRKIATQNRVLGAELRAVDRDYALVLIRGLKNNRDRAAFGLAPL